MTDTAHDIAPSLAAQIILALREGLGVEDIAARGIASADEARRVIARLRARGLIAGVVRCP